jgi:hypothetical protein
MGRVGKRERETVVAPFGSCCSTNPFPIPEMTTVAVAASSSSSSSSSSSQADAVMTNSAWPAFRTTGLSMPQSHLASSSHGLAAVSLVPFARSKPVMPTPEALRAAAACHAGFAPLMPHSLPSAAASARAAQPLRVSASASPESSPGVTTIAPSPTVAEFGSDAMVHSSWQPRALRPVVATDGTPVLSHPAMLRQLTGPLNV